MSRLFDPFLPVVAPITWALIHFLWQGTVIAVGLDVALAFRRNRAAARRYRTACCALALMVALPVVTALLHSHSGMAVHVPGGTTVLPSGIPTAPFTTHSSVPVDASPTAGIHLPALEEIRPWIFAVWLAGVSVLSVVHFAGWRRVRRLRIHNNRDASKEWCEAAEGLCRRLGIERTVRVLASAAAEVPMVIGWLSPVILIPVAAITGMPPDQMRSLLAHELAHVRRRDYVINMLQVAAETVLFFHPAVWWVSKRVRVEREHCCDDIAVALSADRISYAYTLLNLEQLRRRSEFALRADAGSLTQRILRLFGGETMSGCRMNKPWLAGALLASLLLAGVSIQSSARGEQERPGRTVPAPPQDAIELADNSGNPDKGGLHGPRAPHSDVEGRWELGGRGGYRALDLEVTGPWGRANMSIVFDPSDYVGLDYGFDDDFELRREAGTIYLRGDFGGREDSPVGLGEFTFVSNERFIRDMEERGIRNLTEKELLFLAIRDMGTGYMEALQDLGYTGIQSDRLVKLAIHDVDLDFIEEMAALGYENLSLERLVRMRIHGASAEFVKEMSKLGYELDADQLVRWRIHGVTPFFIHAMRAAGLGVLTADDLVKMRIHGVTPELVAELEDLGYHDLDVRDLVRTRIHGVSPGYIRRLQEKGIHRLSIDDLVMLKIHDIDL